MATRYKITQDRWCWCGTPAALVVVGGDESIPVCSDAHGRRTVGELLREHSDSKGVVPEDNPVVDELLEKLARDLAKKLELLLLDEERPYLTDRGRAREIAIESKYE